MVFTIGLGGCSLTNTPVHVIRCVDGLLKISVATPSLVLPQSRLDRWWAGHSTRKADRKTDTLLLETTRRFQVLGFE